jgi:large subunit ribosomal protein L3
MDRRSAAMAEVKDVETGRAAPIGILGRKIGMTQVFDGEGNRFGVTVIEAGPCPVLQVKTRETDGYFAIQLGFGERKEKNTPKPLVGHFLKAKTGCMRFLREIRLDAATDKKVGDLVTVSVFDGVKQVDVSGLSKGKGFQGVMKRDRKSVV